MGQRIPGRYYHTGSNGDFLGGKKEQVGLRFRSSLTTLLVHNVVPAQTVGRVLCINRLHGILDLWCLQLVQKTPDTN